MVFRALPALLLELEGHGDIGDNNLRFFVYAAAKGFPECIVQLFQRCGIHSIVLSRKPYGRIDSLAPSPVFIIDLGILDLPTVDSERIGDDIIANEAAAAAAPGGSGNRSR